MIIQHDAPPVRALHASAKSGYAADRHGTIDRGAIPIASSDLKQAGRLTPAERTYRPGVYQTVDVEEAMKRMTARQKGKLAPIKAGLDDMGRPKSRAKASKRVTVKSVKEPGFEGFDDHTFDQPVHIVEADTGADPFEPAGPEPTDTKLAEPTDAPVNTPVRSDYLAGRIPIVLELDGGAMRMQAIDVLPSEYSVTIILPFNDQSSIFTPKPGAELVLRVADFSYPCYYPAAYFEVPQLGMAGMTFILK